MRRADPGLLAEGDTPRVAALNELGRRVDRWAHRGIEVSRLHPYDDPPSGAGEFFEDPAVVPAVAGIYGPVHVGRFPDGREFLDYDACVPVYRRWQALHLYEVASGGLKVLHAPDWATGRALAGALRGQAEGDLPEVFAWHHRKVLHAPDWATGRALAGALRGQAEGDLPEVFAWHHRKVLHAPDWATGRALAGALRGQAEGDLPEVFAWHHRYDVSSFAKHRQSLEAANWFETYAQRALNVAESEDGADGTFVIAGLAYESLTQEEARVAEEALSRHGVVECDVTRMIRWAAERAIEHQDAGRPRVEEAYRELVEGAIRLLKARGMEFEQIAAATGGPDGPLRELFPDWLAEQHESAMGTLRHRVLPDLTASLGQLLPTPTEADAAVFLAWLEANDLIQVFWHFGALMAFHRRHDRHAVAAAGREVLGMSAAVEHMANALGSTESTLYPKLKELWSGTGRIPDVMERMRQQGVLRSHSEAEFRAKMAMLRTVLTAPGDELACRDLLEAVLIRNHAQHRALGFMRKPELVEAFVTLFRAAFLTWHAVSCRRADPLLGAPR
ncbi:hypothetical protein JYK14_06275 [Siccirubricoccus sp. KC 17139]|uniref:Uncharacterized protein n=1 Tax=Siccirubricoccus soli TaxID=2899147 RepID=A0ABT1D476_9PROT|nr:hypothetical protein [Siccirubricoccus soli]MCO6415785.1 hypothetical protein [Siccirubricoccus soli]MCP2681917.1 hypothetical protein [Siccirubricoccus soli]